MHNNAAGSDFYVNVHIGSEYQLDCTSNSIGEKY